MIQLCYDTNVSYPLARRSPVAAGPDQERPEPRAAQRTGGVPATMISAYERDRRQPTVPTLMRLLKAAGFDRQCILSQSIPMTSVAELDARRGQQDRRRRDRQIDAWRNAESVEAGSDPSR